MHSRVAGELQCLATTINLTIYALMEDWVRFVGKVVATLCITGLAIWGGADGTWSGGFVSAIWVMDMREVVETWYLVRAQRQQKLKEMEKHR